MTDKEREPGSVIGVLDLGSLRTQLVHIINELQFSHPRNRKVISTVFRMAMMKCE
jgi:hypothetical protein